MRLYLVCALLCDDVVASEFHSPEKVEAGKRNVNIRGSCEMAYTPPKPITGVRMVLLNDTGIILKRDGTLTHSVMPLIGDTVNYNVNFDFSFDIT